MVHTHSWVWTDCYVFILEDFFMESNMGMGSQGGLLHPIT
nr:MAG TPA: hypothetical protein [Caudoviricetes sp.]